MNMQPFTVDILRSKHFDDLHDAARTRWPDGGTECGDWDYGTSCI